MEPKYKGWVNGQMRTVTEMHFGEDGTLVSVGFGPRTPRDMYKASKVVLRALTGLKDKNGVETYEGDITKGVSWPAIGKIIYNDGTYWIVTKDWDNALGGMVHDLEVIGNIYENPELLAEAA